tara:strand:+ start:361 stop:618 length:258 start_codon:yes stop_codon:yes gene_type:complete
MGLLKAKNKAFNLFKFKTIIMKKWFEELIINKILKSRKFWYTVIAAVVTFLHDNFGLDPQETENLLYAIIALILGQGVADAAKRK